MIPLTPNAPFTVSFDPLDGSSVIGPNFAVGGIYALWPASDTLVGQSGRRAQAAVVLMYGSRLTAYVAVKGAGCKELTYVVDEDKVRGLLEEDG